MLFKSLDFMLKTEWCFETYCDEGFDVCGQTETTET